MNGDDAKENFNNTSSYKSPMIGIALGGGVARGFAHIGVLKTLNKHGIYPDIIAGTSMGAVIGGCYLAGKMDELEEWAYSLSRKGVFSYLDFKIRSPGLIGGKHLSKVLHQHFGDMRMEDLPHPFITIATDLVNGHEVWLRKGSLIDNIEASYALPGVFPPKEIDHRFLIDGALVNPVPVSVCRSLGARMVIAVDLNADMIGKAAKPGENFQTITGFDMFDENHVSKEDQKKITNPLTRRIFRRSPDSPSLFGVLISSLNIVQDRITRSRLGGNPPDVHIKPYIGHIGLMEFDKARELIAEGERCTEAVMPEIKAGIQVFLPQKGEDT